MSERLPSDLDALLRKLTDHRKEAQIRSLLEEAAEAPPSAGERLRRVEQALEAFKDVGLSGWPRRGIAG